MVKKLTLILFCCVQLSFGVGAYSAAELFSTEVMVASRTSELRELAIEQALAEVVGKVTGVYESSILTPVLERLTASQLVRSYTYKKRARSLEEAAPFQLMLQVSFDQQALTRALIQYGLPVWADKRPITTVWLVLEQHNERMIVGGNMRNEASTTLAESFQHLADKRGLPIVFPILDLEDTDTVSVSDVWGQFSEPLQSASERYGSHVIFSGRIYQRLDGRWFGDWLLMLGHDQHRWKTQGFDREAILATALDQMSQKLANRYAVRDAGQAWQSLQVTISNVHSLADYAGVVRYLDELAVVDNIVVESVRPPYLQVRFRLKGQRRILEETFRLGDTLGFSAPFDGVSLSDMQLQYKP